MRREFHQASLRALFAFARTVQALLAQVFHAALHEEKSFVEILCVFRGLRAFQTLVWNKLHGC